MHDIHLATLKRPVQPHENRWLYLQRGLIIAAVVMVYGWSAEGTNLSLTELVLGWPYLLGIIQRMLPPNLTLLPDLLAPAVETIQISLWGTTLAVIFTIPIGMMAAQNITPHSLLYHSCRLILNATRSISEMIFALVFVAAVGLGPFPGVLALAFHSVGMMGKFLAESIENIDNGPVEALKSAGAGQLQMIRYAIFPQIIPEFISLCLYRLELNFRSATVLGIVGAGGIGFELITSMRLFKYQDTTSILLVILLTVIIMDGICTQIRSRII